MRRRTRGILAAVTAGMVMTACGSADESRPTPTGGRNGTPPAQGNTPGAGATVTVAACTAAGALAEWPVADLAWQVIVVPAQLGNVAGATAVVRAGAGGVILFGFTGPADLAAQIATAGSGPHGVAPLWATDAEGGDVLRDANHLGPVPSARTMGGTMTPAQIRAQSVALGARMRGAGLTMDLAPVADEDAGPGPDAYHPDGTRSFSADPARAAAAVVAFAGGLGDAHVAAVVKHWPGLGGSTGNSDTGPATTMAWPALLSSGALTPFAAGIAAGVPGVMMSNYSVPGLSTLPASISGQAYDALRAEGFTGLVITDSLTAGALSQRGYDVPHATVAAVAAGADMVLFGFTGGRPLSATAAAQQAQATAQATVTAIVAAVAAGTLSRGRLVDAVVHVLAAKNVDPCRP